MLSGERGAGLAVTDVAARPGAYQPGARENINFFGAIAVDVDTELAQLRPTGRRPLRVRDTLF